MFVWTFSLNVCPAQEESITLAKFLKCCYTLGLCEPHLCHSPTSPPGTRHWCPQTFYVVISFTDIIQKF
jgi:hypothetical protein